MHYLLEKKVLNNNDLFIKNHGGQRKVATYFSNAERTINPEFYIQKNILQKLRKIMTLDLF